MISIRKLRNQGYSHNDIIERTGLPPATYWRYHRDSYEEDRKTLEITNREELQNQLVLYHDKIEKHYKLMDEIAHTKDFTVNERIAASQYAIHLADLQVQIEAIGPQIILKDFPNMSEEI
jgi:hypothetical protein